MLAIENAERWLNAIKTMQHRMALQNAKQTSMFEWIYANASVNTDLLAVHIIVHCRHLFLLQFFLYFSCISNCHCHRNKMANNMKLYPGSE